MSTAPTIEDFEKLQTANDELNKQVRERNETIKSLKGTPALDEEKIKALIEETVTQKIAPLTATKEQLEKRAKELEIALAGKPGVPLSSGGSDIKSPEVQKWTPEQLAYFEKMKIDPTKVTGNSK